MFDNMSLRKKLFALSGLAMAALVVAVITGTAGIRSGIQGVDEIGHRRLPSVIALQAIREAQVALKSSTYETGLWENDTDAQDQFEGIAKDKRQQWSKAEEAWKAYEAIPKSTEETELWGRFVKEWDAWKKIDQGIIALIGELAANKDAAKQKTLFQKYFALGGQQRMSYIAAEKLLNEVIDLNAKLVAAETQAAEQATHLAQTLMLIVGISALAVTALLAVLITSSILRQMGGDPAIAVAITRRIAGGDLGVAVPVRPGDDSSLLAAMAYMREHLRSLIGEVLSSADELSRSARSMAQDVSRVAASGEEGSQAAASTAGAVEDIGTRIAQIGDSAEKALSLSDQAGQLSREGHDVVGNAAAEMERISESVRSSSELVQKLGDYSSKISDIVNVIREISDQTNLLALNAAIEAARAGEQGRGFAVVADEVRKLAERTGQSTQEISAMISNIQKSVSEAVTSMQSGRQRVDDGVQLARKASTTMENIQSGAHEARTAVDDINASLREGSQSLRDIGSLMGNIVSMIDDNAQSLAAMNESADRIDRLAAKLGDSVQRFHL